MAELQSELAMHDAMAGRAGVTYAPYSDEQRATLAQQVAQWLASPALDALDPLELLSLRCAAAGVGRGTSCLPAAAAAAWWEACDAGWVSVQHQREIGGAKTASRREGQGGAPLGLG